MQDLPKIDWKIMSDKYWRDTVADGDRKRRRQAEFLVHRTFPWTAVIEIGVMSEAMEDAVRGALVGAAHAPKVAIQKSWYY